MIVQPRLALTLLLSLSLASHSQTTTDGLAEPDVSADTIYLGGPIITINDAQPSVEAVAVKDGIIIVAGPQAVIQRLQGTETRIHDLQGNTLLPGFVDSHGHAYIQGVQATTANLLPPPDGDGKDIPALLSLLTDWAENNQEAIGKVGWIVGFGYDDSQLAEQRHPNRDDLDKVSTELPVLIIHQSGHLGAVNSKALELAGGDRRHRGSRRRCLPAPGGLS
ncbi:amidohydrolase family protein [Marinobacter caseinilyticus]|uniref:amidohydrolase family protein n=1 Tax=Marinobacter caseinilyticus TaxID=2692195 RepID=UPI001A9477BD|nr:amidohydrolase family protein [Marinobacter caseinilyticus]